MKVITEAYLRAAFRKKPFTCFSVAEGQLLTPSAAQFLREKQVKLKQKRKESDSVQQAPPADIEKIGEKLEKTKNYISAVDGAVYTKKPEHMTHLRGNYLVSKDHPRIALRGELDNFQSAVLLLQAEADAAGYKGLVKDLGDILRRVREILKAEVIEKPLEENSVIGLTRAELRDHSHHPRKHYGIGHITPEYDMGRFLLLVNELRSRIRSVELAAVRAFRGEFELQRPDIIESLNAMSSAIYIIMLRQKSAWYTNQDRDKRAT